MKKIYLATLFLGAFAPMFAQAPHAYINRASTAPVIDGVVDEVWASANTYSIYKPFQADKPTLGEKGTTNWKALWTNDGFYLLIRVTDDAFYPNYVVSPPGNDWEYDKPEIFFDVNFNLADGFGPGDTGSGHYYIGPGFTEGKNDGTMFTQPDGVKYAYMVTEPNYIAEYFIPFTLLVDKDGNAIDRTAVIGFDISIIDRDPGPAPRRRAVWSNTGTNESWYNMNDCGTISLEVEPHLDIVTESLTIFTVGGIPAITTESGTLQCAVSLIPLEATSPVKWTVENGTGKASITYNGLLTAIQNGSVTVIAASGIAADSLVITLSNQKVSAGNGNLLLDGEFATDGLIVGGSSVWSTWSSLADGRAEVINGVLKMTPGSIGQNWEMQVYQSDWLAFNDTSYVLIFTVWGDINRTFNIVFEDDPAHNYNRFGTSDDPQSNGWCDWIIPVTKSPVTWTLHTTVCCLDKTSIPRLLMMTGDQLGSVYIDNIAIYKESDLTWTNKFEVNLPSEKTISCGESLELNPSVYYNGTGELTYSWSPSEGLSAPDIRNPVVSVTANKEYTLTVTATDYDPIIKTISLNVSSTSLAPSICAVNIDENDRNVVVVKKEQSSGIEAYFVFRESQLMAGQYDLIGQIPYSDNAVFVDAQSNARVQSNKYRIAIKDLCGFVTEKSPEHKTMHLTINQGAGNTWNLFWEPYLGVPISSYKIFRGTSKSDLAEIGNTSGSNTSFTDLTAPAGDVYYQILGILSQSCTTLKSTEYASVRSNIISSFYNSVYNSTGKSGIPEKQDFIYPNPATDKLSLRPGYPPAAAIVIYNSLGKQVLTSIISEQIDISGLSKGIYIVKLIDNGKSLVNKFVKE
jgi:hypothetical protein